MIVITRGRLLRPAATLTGLKRRLDVTTTANRRADGPSVVIADDHPATAEGLARGLSERCGIPVVACCVDGSAALAAIREHRPAVALLDLQMPQPDGHAVLNEVVRLKLPTRVVICSMFYDPALVRTLLDHGARGYLAKTSTAEEVAAAVRRVVNGSVVVSPNLQQGLNDELASPRRSLSPRERQVLTLASHGLKDREIAGELYISRETVRTLLKRCSEKLGVQGRTALVAKAIRLGLLA
jgi:two-component system nitrate/nitrite response regulator NarL